MDKPELSIEKMKRKDNIANKRRTQLSTERKTEEICAELYNRKVHKTGMYDHWSYIVDQEIIAALYNSMFTTFVGYVRLR